jgi:SAM-dependent methyltransferase
MTASPQEDKRGPEPPAAAEDPAALQRRYFDGLVDVFAATPPAPVLERLGRIVALAKLVPGERVLDVGTGAGVLLPFILKHEPSHLSACDLSAEMLAHVAARFPGVETVEGDVARLGLPAASFECIFLNAVFPNLPDKPAALFNLARLIIPGGRMVISHPEGRGFVLRLKEEVPFHIDPLPEEAELARLLAPHPLRLETFVDEPSLYAALIKRIP